MSDAWHDMREEERSERRRQRQHYRTDPPATDIHSPQAAAEGRRAELPPENR
ncbi:hypothetical protein [Isoptericola sp. NPDC056605]|uniref:hypothetical protein n=1 Tax=Isoptericola sp. NPDC056605 TaxID=3345876 RepID=UPI0036B0820B